MRLVAYQVKASFSVGPFGRSCPATRMRRSPRTHEVGSFLSPGVRCPTHALPAEAMRQPDPMPCATDRRQGERTGQLSAPVCDRGSAPPLASSRHASPPPRQMCVGGRATTTATGSSRPPSSTTSPSAASAASGRAPRRRTARSLAPRPAPRHAGNADANDAGAC